MSIGLCVLALALAADHQRDDGTGPSPSQTADSPVGELQAQRWYAARRPRPDRIRLYFATTPSIRPISAIVRHEADALSVTLMVRSPERHSRALATRCIEIRGSKPFAMRPIRDGALRDAASIPTVEPLGFPSQCTVISFARRDPDV